MKADCGPRLSPDSWGAPLGPRTNRILLGKRAEEPGVVGRTLMDEWGDLEIRAVGVTTVSILLDDMEEAFE